MKNLTLIFFSFLSFLATGQDNRDKNEKLYQAIVSGDKTSVTALLADNANAAYVKTFTRLNKTNLLITAVNQGDSEIVKMLIDHNADLEWKDGYGRTALMYAAQTGKLNLVQLLIESGASINATDGRGYTVMSAAKEGNDPDVIAFLEEKMKKK